SATIVHTASRVMRLVGATHGGTIRSLLAGARVVSVERRHMGLVDGILAATRPTAATIRARTVHDAIAVGGAGLKVDVGARRSRFGFGCVGRVDNQHDAADTSWLDAGHRGR